MSRESSPENGEDGAEPLSRESTPEMNGDGGKLTFMGEDHEKGKELIFSAVFLKYVFLSNVVVGFEYAAGKGNDLSVVSDIDASNSIATGRRCVSCMCFLL